MKSILNIECKHYMEQEDTERMINLRASVTDFMKCSKMGLEIRSKMIRRLESQI